MANVDQILYEASLGWGKGCIKFWDRLDQNSGFHGNRKRLLTYNGENDFSTFSRLFLIRFFLYLQVMRTCIRSRIDILWNLQVQLTFQTLEFFVTLFLVTVRPRRLKLDTHVGSGQMYHVYWNQAAAAYSSLYFFIFIAPLHFSFQFSNIEIFRHTFLKNCEA